MKKCMRAVAAALIAAGVWGTVPVSARADFSITPRLSATYGGVTVTEEVASDDLPLMAGEEFVSANGEWEVHFLEPFNAEEIPAARGLYVLARLDPDTYVAQPGYQTVHAAIPADNGDSESPEVQAVTFGPPYFGQPGVPSGVYELSAHSYPDTKLVCQEEPPYECAEEPYTDQDFLDWYYWTFAVDWDTYEGEEPVTYEPTNSRAVLFEYVAPEFPAGPSLSLSEEPGYDSQHGVNPRKGVADKDLLSFKVVYTHPDNIAPERVEVKIGTTTLSMAVDSAAENPLMHDGDYSNGEQYIAQSSFPKSQYTYRFEAEVGGETHLLENPEFVFQTGYSSIIFLPGIKGSELYRINGIGNEDKLWFPTTRFSNDVAQLAMNEQGESVVDDIYTNDILDQVLTTEVYGPFLSFGQSLAEAGVVSEFVPFPYDWRYDVRDVVANPVLLRDGQVYSMPERLSQIASDSDSGKVIIMSHSNGGLVGKALISKLEEDDRENLVEKFIMVGTPQLGTPDAVSAILHGYGQAKFPFVSSPASRFSSQHMLSALALMPLGNYDITTEPLITFGPLVSATEAFREYYGESIESQEELKSFLSGNWASSRDKCINPYDLSLDDPICLDATLLDRSIQTRIFLEEWSVPKEIEVIEIAGFNRPTISSIHYKQKKGCNTTLSSCLIVEPQPLGVGDGTVIYASATGLSNVQSYIVDLLSFGSFQHFNLLNIPELQGVLEGLVKGSNPSLEKGIYPKGIELPSPHFIVLKAFSPVTLEVRDVHGNKIETEYNKDLDTEIIHQQIPRGQYFSVGETKMIVVPQEGEYEVSIEGIERGILQIELEEYEGGKLIAERIHENIPVTESTRSTFSMTKLEKMGSIQIDVDGDGSSDVVLEDPNKKTPQEIIAQLRIYVKQTPIKFAAKAMLLIKLKNIERHIDKKHIVQATKEIHFLKVLVGLSKNAKLLSEDQKNTILLALDELSNLLKR